MLNDHVLYMLLEMNGFFDMGEDVIEGWHQTRAHHRGSIRRLRSNQIQKIIQAKYEDANVNTNLRKYL